MTAALDLPDVRRGDDWTHTLRFWTDATKTTGVNLTSRTYTAQMRQDADDTSPAATFTIDATNLATGVVLLSLAHAVTATLEARSYVWDLQESAAGVITTLLAGRVAVVKDVTR